MPRTGSGAGAGGSSERSSSASAASRSISPTIGREPRERHRARACQRSGVVRVCRTAPLEQRERALPCRAPTARRRALDRRSVSRSAAASVRAARGDRVPISARSAVSRYATANGSCARTSRRSSRSSPARARMLARRRRRTGCAASGSTSRTSRTIEPSVSASSAAPRPRAFGEPAAAVPERHAALRARRTRARARARRAGSCEARHDERDPRVGRRGEARARPRDGGRGAHRAHRRGARAAHGRATLAPASVSTRHPLALKALEQRALPGRRLLEVGEDHAFGRAPVRVRQPAGDLARGRPAVVAERGGVARGTRRGTPDSRSGSGPRARGRDRYPSGTPDPRPRRPIAPRRAAPTSRRPPPTRRSRAARARAPAPVRAAAARGSAFAARGARAKPP